MYQDIVGFALSTPGWMHVLAEVGTDAGLFVFAVLFVVAAVRAWRAPARDLALVVAGPAGIVIAYVVSEVVKAFVKEDRPCRGGVATIAACPPLDDWSFPSNHSVIAAGAAVTLVLAWRALAWAVLPLAVLIAFSRVFVGVHYPHDVAAGFVLGAVLAPLFTLLLVGAVTPAVRLVRDRSSGRSHQVIDPIGEPFPSHGAGAPQSYGASSPHGYGTRSPQGRGAGSPQGRSAGAPYHHGAGSPQDRGAGWPQDHGADAPHAYGASSPQGRGAGSPQGYGAGSPRGHGADAP